jgi:hypothetical protein
VAFGVVPFSLSLFLSLSLIQWKRSLPSLTPTCETTAE